MVRYGDDDDDYDGEIKQIILFRTALNDRFATCVFHLTDGVPLGVPNRCALGRPVEMTPIRN